MIVEQYKFINIHIKKCGGSSLASAFQGEFQTHATFLQYVEKLGPSIVDYFVWSVVRNPWDRMVSLFHYQKQNVNQIHTDDFKRFLEDIYVSHFYKTSKDYHYEWKPQISYLCDHEGHLALDYLCYLPNIHEDFDKVKKVLQIPKSVIYPHTNKSKHENYKNYYTPLTKNYVAKLFQKEIEMFEFDFDDVSRFKYPIKELESDCKQKGWRERLHSKFVNS